ncbi:MAG: hypothetical protein HON04_19595 [Planctomicrobium sp.]|jgi:hypothetical protein|nr:hypothetical protein [Planctomicrobium sp.]
MAKQSKDNSNSELRSLNRDTKEDPSFVSKLPDGNLLSQILGFSDNELNDNEHLHQIEATLRPVAARYQPDQQLNESITRELVSALIPDIKGLSPPLSEQLVEWVARTLFSDPMAHGRLESMWVQLIGRSSDGRN